MTKPARKHLPISQNVSAQDEMSNGTGAWGSGGSLCNPMYRHIHNKGAYSPYSGRNKKRINQKARGVCLSKKWKFWELGMVGNKGVK